MAIKRYTKRNKIFNNSILIEKILNIKNIKGIRQFTSPNFKMPTFLDKEKIDTESVYWKRGDRLYKYAEKYYLNPDLWWIIGLYNNKPTDAHFQIGDVIYIPIDLEQLLQYVEV
jgi:hypothetical protein